MKIPELRDEVKGKVYFVCLKNHELWYKTDSGFDFPIPLEDSEGGIFLSEDKASLFMRWIRKRIQNLKDEESFQLLSKIKKEDFEIPYRQRVQEIDY